MDPELIVYGGAGAGKSYSIADKLLLQPIYQPDRPLKALVIRQTFPSLRTTALEILQKRAETLKIPFKLNKSDWTAYVANLKIIFLSLHHREDYNKLKSQTDIDFVWLNEVTELREDDYEEILRRVRGGQSKFDQVISDFNPVGRHSWVYKRFFDPSSEYRDVKKLRYTVLDNHPDFLRTAKARRYISKLRRTRHQNINLYKIYFLGEWGELKGVIFSWPVVPMPTSYDDLFYGGDFGFSVDPAALIAIYRKADQFYFKEIIYETGLTNKALAKRMIQEGIDVRKYSYWDCAEPKSIQEIKDHGIRGAKPCLKGPDSVKRGSIIFYRKNVTLSRALLTLRKSGPPMSTKKTRTATPSGSRLTLMIMLCQDVAMGFLLT